MWLYGRETHPLSLPDPILALSSMDLLTCLPGYGQTYQSAQRTNNAQTPPYPKNCGHVLSLRVPGLYHIQSIDHIKMADDLILSRKQLEMQRVELLCSL